MNTGAPTKEDNEDAQQRCLSKPTGSCDGVGEDNLGHCHFHDDDLNDTQLCRVAILSKLVHDTDGNQFRISIIGATRKAIGDSEKRETGIGPAVKFVYSQYTDTQPEQWLIDSLIRYLQGVKYNGKWGGGAVAPLMSVAGVWPASATSLHISTDNEQTLRTHPEARVVSSLSERLQVSQNVCPLSLSKDTKTTIRQSFAEGLRTEHGSIPLSINRLTDVLWIDFC